MPDPEIRELRYFRAVAEDLNITRAAQRLGIAQPPLSRAMRQLERRLGVELFDRTDQRITLTTAGETFLKESAQVLDALDAAVRRTRRAGLPARTLVVTAKPGVATELLRDIVEQFQTEPDGPEINIAISGFGEQVGMVRDGRADVAIVSRPFDDHGLESELLVVEPRVAALPVGHPLAARETLVAEDLAGLPAPRWSLALRNGRPDVVYRPVTDVAEYETLVVWQAGNRSQWVARFVQAALKRSSGRPGER